MKLSRKLKHAIMLCLYLCRSGRAHIHDAAEQLGTTREELMHVAKIMLESNILNYIIGEGFELEADTTFAQVFEAVEPIELLKKHEFYSTMSNAVESRVLTLYSVNLRMALQPLLRRKIKSSMQELIANEVAILDRFTAGREN